MQYAIVPATLDRNIEAQKRFAVLAAFVEGEGFASLADFLRACGCDAPAAARVGRLLRSLCVGAVLKGEAADPFAGLGNGVKQ
jgi:hypothetical protein